MDRLSTRMMKVLKAYEIKVASAESCTGGGIAKMLTEYAGSSFFFEGGVVTYTPEMKAKILGVPMSMIEEYGVVSQEVAKAMAKGVAELTGANYGVSTTGIAGPGGATRKHGVGVVFISVYNGKDYFNHMMDVSDGDKIHDRAFIRDFATRNAIHLLLNTVENDYGKVENCDGDEDGE